MLIVDDEPSVRDLLTAFFEERFEVRQAASAEEALPLVLEESFDVLLIDKNLPGMNGVELIRQVRELNDDVAIAMITGYPSAESIVDTLNLGIDAYIEKPFNSLQEFGTLIDAILSRRKAPIPAVLLARDPARVPRVVAAIGDGQERTVVAEALGALQATLVSVGTERELLALLTPEPDVVLLDTEAWGDWSPDIVEKIAEKAPFAGCVILSCGNVTTPDLRRLVDLCVVAVLMWRADPDWKSKLLQAVRRVLAPPP
jgi:DNA-binding response OmpR family regulator